MSKRSREFKVSDRAFAFMFEILQTVMEMRDEKGLTKIDKEAIELVRVRLANVLDELHLKAVNAMVAQELKPK